MNSTIPLSGASKEQLADYLADAFATFTRMSGRATALRSFEEAARKGGAAQHLTNDHRELIKFALDEGCFLEGAEEGSYLEELLKESVEKTIESASVGIRIAAAVVVHTAFEDYLLRLCRVGCAVNRLQAVQWVERRTVAIQEVATSASSQIVDKAIEAYLADLESKSVLIRWDRLMALVGCPPKLASPQWKFDRDMLESFDAIRHEAVHGEAKKLATFDLWAFQIQLQRAAMAICFFMCKTNGLKVSPNIILFGSR